MSDEKTDLDLAEELESLDGEMTLEDQTFVEYALKVLRKKKRLKVQDSAKLRKIWNEYLGEKGGDEKNQDEQDLDDDDFV